MSSNRTERLRRWVFARHAHPVSAWTRWASMPLLVVPLWTRRWKIMVPVTVWMAVNPVITPPVKDDHAFATRAILGEERWLADRSLGSQSTALNAAGSVCLIVAAVGAWQRRALPMSAGLAGAMALTLVQWRNYAEIYDRSSGEGGTADRR